MPVEFCTRLSMISFHASAKEEKAIDPCHYAPSHGLTVGSINSHVQSSEGIGEGRHGQAVAKRSLSGGIRRSFHPI